jgi:succinate dehydrogenase/fumarate reductase flavoprotein subunit
MQQTTLKIAGRDVPVTCVNTVIVGAGAAGMCAAVQLVRNWRALGVKRPHEKLVVVTGGLPLGASRMSGSDKQTYYKMGTSPRVPDTARDFAETLTAGGACHGDTALVEGLCSLRGFYNLVEMGVPFPHGPFGGFAGYKTDNDPSQRGTSAGPKTSRFMSHRLQAEAERLGVRIVDSHPLAELLTTGEGDARRIVAAACFDLSRTGQQDMGLSLFVAESFILAAGGPGELYAATVYPRGQWGIHGAAFEAGLAACNLTESQYGLASIKHRWNVSGTYMQVVPRIFSTDADGGDEREFLTEYFPETATMATAIFLKGYQWPFDAERVTGYQSSLVDMAVHQETVVRGRRVWMDFLRNPAGADGWEPFDMDRLGAEAREYLHRAGALQPTPIERLKHMNPPAVELYAENDIDLHAEPLEIALCAQHMNGGFAVDKWWRGNVPHTFVVGEMAGTHGVKRPGGAALNAGQVGAMRAAEYIAAVYGSDEPAADRLEGAVAGAAERLVARLEAMLGDGETTCEEAMDEIRRRMTRCGAHLRSADAAAEALDAAVAQVRGLREGGLRVPSPAELPKAIRTLQQALTHAAILQAVCALFERDAGSRGSHCILDPEGEPMHPRLIEPDTNEPYRFRPENEALRNHVLTITYNPDAERLFDVRDDIPRPIPDRDVAFEPAWAEFREGRIYGI